MADHNRLTMCPSGCTSRLMALGATWFLGRSASGGYVSGNLLCWQTIIPVQIYHNSNSSEQSISFLEINCYFLCPLRVFSSQRVRRRGVLDTFLQHLKKTHLQSCHRREVKRQTHGFWIREILQCRHQRTRVIKQITTPLVAFSTS